MESLRQLQSNIEEVLYFCEVQQKTKLQTIEILEILFDYYRTDKVDLFFEWDYYQRYIKRLEEIRNCNTVWKIYSEDETLFI